MRMERDHRGWPLGCARSLDDAANDLLVADVHAVEISDRCDAAARKVRLSQWVVKDQHWVVILSEVEGSRQRRSFAVFAAQDDEG
jgi:hypothetical protein